MVKHLLLVVSAFSLTCSSKAKPGGGGESGNSVLERNNHASRDGHFVQPALTRAAAATMATDADFAATFTGAMWASPLYMENGVNQKGTFFVATTSNDVIALDESTGATIWTKNVSTPATGSGVGCVNGNGGIPSLGILSTPVIDASSRTIVVAGATGDQDITDHFVTALWIDGGMVQPGWPVDVSGKLQFDPTVHNQRSALSLVNGIVYVAYGGFVGDCGAYHGRVAAIPIAGPQSVAGWATGGQGEGIWASAGMASDGNTVFVATGNRTGGGSSTHQDSEEVVALTGMATKGATFFPSRWQTMDNGDADLGSVNPMFVRQAGSTPANMVVQISKDGHLYLLDAANLGGSDGFKVDFPVAASGMSIHTAPAAYTTAQGLYVVFSTDSGAMCPGGGGGHSIVAVRITAGSPPSPVVAWCGALSGATTAPIATTTDGQADAIVWYMSNGKLVALDGDTGTSLYTSSDTCSGVHQWTSPIAVKGRIVAGGDGHLCSWSPH
ncbi:MAG TPA: PQQ-binding-like beta-propeller repeat protein [Polyangia bacterium]|nr:PQQ-binding-like beta-propeller repeat protein [Polyangia bacterium]